MSVSPRQPGPAADGSCTCRDPLHPARPAPLPPGAPSFPAEPVDAAELQARGAPAHWPRPGRRRARPRPGHPGRPLASYGGGAAWLAGFAAAGAGLFLCYLRLSQATAVNSDGASNVLQAWDMLHGNPVLHGWWLSDVSFYTTELPQYVLVESVRGLGPDVVHVAAAMTYTLLVLLAGLLAKGRAGGREGLVRLLIAVGVMLAPQLGSASYTLLLSPDHVGTGVPLLLIWLIIDRARPRWYVPVVAGALLAWVQVADSLALLIGVLPLVIACAARTGWQLARGEPGRGLSRRLAGCWYELSLAAAAIASAGAARLAALLIRGAGGYRVWPPGSRLAGTWSLLYQNAVLAYRGVLGLFGADLGGQRGPEVFFAAVHLVGVAMVGWALCIAALRFFRSRDLLVPAFAAAMVINVAAYVVSVTPVNILSTREVAIVLPFGAVLAGRLLAGPLTRVSRPARTALIPAVAACLLCYLAALGYDAAQRPVPAENQDLAAWLARHHLSSGLGGYWQANSTTADSGGQVHVRAMIMDGGRVVRPYLWETKRSWYDPRSQRANFVVSARQPSTEAERVSPALARQAFGRPARTYRFGRYTVMVWDKNLLSLLSPGQNPDA